MAAQLLDMFAFLSVLLRAGALGLTSLVLGGIAFLTIVRPGGPALAAVRRMVFGSAVMLALVQAVYVTADSTVLAATAGLHLSELAGAGFFLAGLASVCAAVTIAISSARVSGQLGRGGILLIAAGVAWGALVFTSHAAGRLEHRTGLMLLTALHQGATATWIGGLPYLLLALRRCGEDLEAARLCRRFSRLAIWAVGSLVLSGVVLSKVYVGSVAALYGTSYGAMVAAKVLLLAMVLGLGGVNFLILRRPVASSRLIFNLRRFAEAEAGIGFTIILLAASLTSQPPASDLPTPPVRADEIAQRMHPRWPRMETPPLSTLSPATPLEFGGSGQTPEGLMSFVPGTSYKPSTPGDIAWSEYNHHWAGLIVLAAGILAVLARWNRAKWARHWPLAFLGLAVFLFLRADPENWPLGPRSFWQSFAVPDVLQHRLFVLLIVAFAGFEWAVRTGRIVSEYAALVFPAVCALGGALLVTHTHALSNLNEELLVELSHLPLAIFAVAAGWSRWLEIRLAGPQRRVVGWVWPICFVLIGAVLVNYREA